MKNPTQEEVEQWTKEYGYDYDEAGDDCDCCAPQRRVFSCYLKQLETIEGHEATVREAIEHLEVCSSRDAGRSVALMLLRSLLEKS